MMRRLLLTFLLIAALHVMTTAQAPPPAAPAQAAPAPQQPGGQPAAPQATFRTSTRLVVQSVWVKDKQGNPIQGLTARDFVVFEENEAQEVAFAEYQRIEGEPGSAPPEVVSIDAPAAPQPATVAPLTQTEIATPPPGTLKYQNRRLLVIYFDQSSMGQADQYRAFTNALKFVETKLAAADMVAIITFQNGAVRVRQDFTADRAAMREVLLTLQAGDDLNGDGIADAPETGTAFGQSDGEFNVFNTDRQLAALQTAVTMLRGLSEQKTLIYFGSGLRLNGSDNMAQLRATTNAAVRANVTINPIDARGLEATAPLGNAESRGPSGQALFSGSGSSTLARNQQSQDSLFALAKDTGGKAMFDYNDLSLGIVQAAQAVTDYYLVGYYSTHTATDGKFRRVRMSLAGNRQGELAYRQGYFADKTFANFTNADKERQLEEALMLEDPVTEITIAMELNYFQLNRAEYYVPVAMKIPGSELNLARRRGAARTTLDFIGEIKDEYGNTITNIRDKMDKRLSDEDAEQLAIRPIQYESGYTLLPGKYVIKVLVRDATTGRIGTYQTQFEVPDLVREKTRLPISSVVLSSQRVPLGDELFAVEQKVATDAVNPLIHDGQKLVPSVTRVFSKSRDLFVFLQTYQRGATAIRPVVAFVTFYRGEEKAFETTPLPVVDGLEPRSKAVPMKFSVPLTDFPPGRYDCQVTVLDPSTQKAAFWRAPIVIVP